MKWSTVSAAFIAAYTYFKNNPKRLIIALVIAAACFGGYKVKESFEELEAKNTELVTQVTSLTLKNNQLQTDVASCVEANKTNQDTIKKLGATALDYEKQVADLNKTKAAVIQRGNDMLLNIARSTPDQDGPVAGVLESTINSIQQYRKEQQ